jgi:hypothetical protein
LLGLFNGLVLESLHGVSHIWGAETHHHSFASDHGEIDYSSLEAMAGHSHETLEVLKELLLSSESDKQESKDEFSFKLDKHLADEAIITSEINTVPIGNRNWTYQHMTSFWCQNITTPPPQYC